MFDILITHGNIVDGTGSPWFPGDLAIEGDRIAAIGNLAGAEARRTIDAAGKTVCPGFVDCHSHTDRTILVNREATSSIYQGVTTEIVGNCGLIAAPICERNRTTLESFVASICPDLCIDWQGFGEFLDRVAAGTAVNFAAQVGHSPLRRGTVGMENRAPTEDELRQMERMAAQALDEGAIGLSFGLEFMPGFAAGAEELRRLCAVAAGRHKMTSWHVRNRDRRFVEAVQEALDATRAAGAGLQLSHLSAKPGATPRVWNRCMEALRLARAQGQDVQCDMIPYTTGPGLLSAILPDWAVQGTPDEISDRLRQPAVRRQLLEQTDRYWLLFHHREWDKLTLSGHRAHPDWIGLTFREIGARAGKDPFEVVFDLLAEAGEGLWVWINGVLFSEGDIVEWLADPTYSIASDGYAVTDSGPLAATANHPGNYGWTPTVIEKYVGELRAFSLETAILKMTSQPAARFGIYDRGLLRAGAYADLLVFDPQKFKTRATYLEPNVYAEGMDYVFVNGRAALDAGAPTGALAGRVLRR